MPPEDPRRDAPLPADDELVAGLRAGDDEVFALLLDAWSPSMLRVARAHVSTSASAEEVVQETWLAVIRGIDGFRGLSSLRTWVYRILVNQARTRGVRESRTLPMASLAGADGGSGPSVDPDRFLDGSHAWQGHWRAPPEPWPEDVLLGHEVRDVVAAAVATLPPRQRLVITLRDVEGHTAEEVRAMLDLTAGNQRVLLHRARSVVRRLVEEYVAARPAAGRAR